MKTPGANFINILRASFTPTDPKSTKKLLDLTVFFMFLGSELVKAAHRTLMKLTPDLPAFNFPNRTQENHFLCSTKTMVRNYCYASSWK